MADIKWIKVSTDMFDRSRKIKQIEQMPKADTILVIWLKLMLLAGSINDGGAIYVTPEIPYEIDMLAGELRRPKAVVKSALDTFERFGMIEITDGIIRLPSWEKYQDTDRMADIREQNRIRQQRKRENKKLLLGVSRDSHVTVTEREGVTQRDSHATEEEREEDIHSFNQSLERAPAPAPAREEKVAFRERSRFEQKYRRDGDIFKSGHIMLSDEQLEKLCEELSYDELRKYVSIVEEQEENGHRYTSKTHFQAIMDMAKKDRRIDR